MNSFSTKFRLLFVPYLLITILFIVAYSFFNWLALVDTGMKENIENVAIPILLGPIFVFMALYPRLSIVKFKKNGTRDAKYFFFFLTWLTMVLPTIIAQEYLLTATGELTRLPDITAIDSHSLTKYYVLNKHYIDTNHVARYYGMGTSGKHNQFLDMSVDVVCPIVDKKPKPIRRTYFIKAAVLGTWMWQRVRLAIVVDGYVNKDTIDVDDVSSIDSVAGRNAMHLRNAHMAKETIVLHLKKTEMLSGSVFKPKAWLGVRFSKTIDNPQNQLKKEKAWRDFQEESLKWFTNKNLNQFVYMDRLGNNETRDRYIEAVKLQPELDNGNYLVFEAHHESFTAHNGNTLTWLLVSLIVGSGLWLIYLLTLSKINDDDYYYSK